MTGIPRHGGEVLNSSAPGKFEWNFRHVIFKHILVIDALGIPCKIALILMLLDFTDDQSTLVQVMAWCRQATSHYLSQCWPRSLLQYGVNRPEWVLKMKSKHQILKIAYWNKKWICWEIITVFSTMPPNAVTSPLLMHTIVHWRNGWPGPRPTKDKSHDTLQISWH